MTYRASHLEVKKAFMNFFNAQDGTYEQAIKHFYRVTGVNTFIGNFHYDVTEEQLHRIRAFAGPHGKTMVKAYLAQQEASD